MSNQPTNTESNDDQTTINAVADEFQFLTYEVENNVAIVSVDRPDALNALNSDLLFELSVAFELAEAARDLAGGRRPRSAGPLRRLAQPRRRRCARSGRNRRSRYRSC